MFFFCICFLSVCLSVCFFVFVLSFFFRGVILLFSSGSKRWYQFDHYNISGHWKMLNYNGLRQMGFISLQWDLKSETCQGISDLEFYCWGSFVFVWWAIFSQGCCVFIQCNLLKGCCEWILIQPWTQVIDYSLPGLTWHIRLRTGIADLSISGIVVHGRCYIPTAFTFPLFSIFCYFLWLFVGWSLFFLFFCFHVS